METRRSAPASYADLEEGYGPPIHLRIPANSSLFERQSIRAAIFADSLARVFNVRVRMPITYFIVRNLDEIHRLDGFAADTVILSPSGRSGIDEIVSGDPEFGELHAHEIAHVVLGSYNTWRTTGAASEGVAAWLGGSRSKSYPMLRESLRDYMLAQPGADLTTFLGSAHPLHHAAAALLAHMAHDCGGPAGIRQLLNSGPSQQELQDGLVTICRRPWSTLLDDWTERAVSLN